MEIIHTPLTIISGAKKGKIERTNDRDASA
jgi:hypothetical protein